MARKYDRNQAEELLEQYNQLQGDYEHVAAMAAPEVPLPEVPRKAPQFWEWMDRQVIPAMVNYQLENTDTDVLKVLSAMFKDRLARRQADDPQSS